MGFGAGFFLGFGFAAGGSAAGGAAAAAAVPSCAASAGGFAAAAFFLPGLLLSARGLESADAAPGAGGFVPVYTRTGSPMFTSCISAPFTLPGRRFERNTP